MNNTNFPPDVALPDIAFVECRLLKRLLPGPEYEKAVTGAAALGYGAKDIGVLPSTLVPARLRWLKQIGFLKHLAGLATFDGRRKQFLIIRGGTRTERAAARAANRKNRRGS